MIMQNNPLTSLLNSLLVIHPPERLILIGAGNGSSFLVDFLLQNNIACATLVEPQDASFRQLEALVASTIFASENWILTKDVVAKQSGEIDFYYANKSSESGLVDPENLIDIWPNLRLNQKVTLEAVSLSELCSQNNQAPNWLMLDCLGALQIVNHDSNLLSFDVIVVRVLFDLENQTDTDAGYSEICHILNAQGFKENLKHAEQHPNVGYVVFTRDYKSQSIGFIQQLSELTATHEQTIAQHKAEQLVLQEAKQVNEAQAKKQAEASTQQQTKIQQLQQQLSELTATHEQTIAQHKAEQLVLQEAKQVNEAQAKQQAEANAQQRVQIQQLDEKLTNILNEQKNQISKLQNNLTHELSKGLGNTAKQIESFIGVQNYLEQGQLPFSYHGWPISPDVALFLLGKIEDNNYDLIIEFGSGTSTALFASALLKKNQRLTPQNKNSLINSDSSSRELLDYYEPSSLDLPRRIVTFEHNKNYYTQTLDSLTKLGVEQVVDMVYAPLVDYQYNGENYLYYSCISKLQEIAKIFNGREAKILVLVDGPPGATGPLARLPAIPHLLDCLSQHKIHLVLDDYARSEEKTIATKWQEILDERSITYESESISSEKGVYFCQIN